MITVEAMLCESGSEKDLDNPLLAGEIKYDGTRIWAGKDSGTPFVINRKNIEYTNRLPEIIEALNGISSEDFIFDGEAVHYDREGRTNFTGSQRRCSTEDPNKQRELRPKYPIIMESFDLVRLDGKDISDYTWETRKQLLKDLLQESRQKHINYAQHTITNKRKLYEEAVERGEEGLILKEVNSRYIGKRSSSWLKVKKWYSERCKVVGYTEGSGSREDKFGSLVLAKLNDDGYLEYCGKVGSGFNYAEVKHLSRLLRENIIENNPVEATDSTDKPFDYTPVDSPFEVTVKFYETSKNGVFRFPSMLKDKQGNNLIHYDSKIEGKVAPKQMGLEALLKSLEAKR